MRKADCLYGNIEAPVQPSNWKISPGERLITLGRNGQILSDLESGHCLASSSMCIYAGGRCTGKIQIAEGNGFNTITRIVTNDNWLSKRTSED